MTGDWHKICTEEYETAEAESFGAVAGWCYGKGEIPPKLTEVLTDALRAAFAGAFNHGYEACIAAPTSPSEPGIKIVPDSDLLRMQEYQRVSPPPPLNTTMPPGAFSVSVEPVPSTPTVPGSTERPEGLSAEILDLRGHEITKRHDGTLIRYVLTGVTIPTGTVIGGFDFDPETGAVGWSQVNAGKPPVADVAPVWAGPGCCRAVYEDGHAHDHPSGPRVFAMPEIPEDVSAVRDAGGWTWKRVHPQLWTHVGVDDPHPYHTGWLMGMRGPLAEVEETNDAD